MNGYGYEHRTWTRHPRGHMVNESIARDMKFVQLAATAADLFALDAHGNVWQYYPAESDRGHVRYAFWGRKTSRGSDATGKALEHQEGPNFGESGGRRRR